MKKFSKKIKCGVFFSAIFVIAILSLSPAFGDEPASIETEEEKGKTYMKIGTVVVEEKQGYFTTADIPASIDIIGEDQLNYGTVNSSAELMKRVPGVYYGYWNQGVASGLLGIRGFKPSKQIALIVDGIPYNRTAGDVVMDPYFPMEIERMELLRGPVDPRWGSFDIAGNLNIFTKRGGNRNEAKVLYGSFNTVEGNALIAREKGGFSQTYFVAHRTSDGYRDNSDQQKGAVSGKWFYTTADDKLDIGLIARYFKWEADAPGYLTKELAEQDPEQMMVDSKTDGGEQEDKHVSLHIDLSLTDQLSWSFKTYWQKLQRTRWSTWSPGGDQGERYRDDDQYGALSKLYFETPDFGIKNLKLEWGLDFQHSDNTNNRYRPTDNRVSVSWRKSGGDPWNWEYTNKNWGSYLKTDAVFTDWIQLMLGIRMDRFDGDFENPAADKEYDMMNFGTIWQPTAGIMVTPYHGYNIYGNWGRSFQIPAEQNRFLKDPTKPDIDHSNNDGWEIGTKCSPTDWLVFRLAYWEMKATDEVKWVADINWYDNVGETKRKGWDAEISLKPVDWTILWAAYTRQEGEYGDGVNKGNSIEIIPEYTAKIGADFTFPHGFSAGIWLESVGDYYIDDENQKPEDGSYDVVNMRLAYTRDNVLYALDVNNLFDEEYYGYIWDSSSDYGYSPGDGRGVYASITWKF